jgi:hypothetical protein
VGGERGGGEGGRKVTFTRAVIDSSPTTLKKHTFFDIKHLYTAWVANAAGFRVR